MKPANIAKNAFNQVISGNTPTYSQP